MLISIFSFICTILNIIVDKKGDLLYTEDIAITQNDNPNKEFYESVVISKKSSIEDLPPIFWFTTFFIVFCYGSYMPFNFITSGFLTENFFINIPKDEAEKKAGMYMSLPYAISCILVPIIGKIIDKFGKRAYITVLSAFLGIFGFSSFFFLGPIFGFIFIGFSYSLTANVGWNIISIVVNSECIVLIKILS